MLYALLGAYVGGGWTAFAMARTWCAALVVGLVVAFGFVINDYCDLTTDSYNCPDRPLPSGTLSLRTARLYMVCLAGAAIVLACLLGLREGIFALATVALSSGYSYRLKGTVLLGNATIAVLDASIVVYGAMVSGGLRPAILMLGGSVALYAVAEEILFTIKDREGDQRAGLHTIATRWGISASLRVYRLVVLAFMVSAPLPWVFGLAPARFVVAIACCSMIPTAVIALVLTIHPTREQIVRGAGWMKLVWLSSVLPVLSLRAH